MEKSWLLALLILHMIQKEAAFDVVGWIGVGNFGGGGAFRTDGANNQTPSEPSNTRLDRAFTALQAWKSAITDDPSGILDTWNGSNVCTYRGVFCSNVQEEMPGSPGLVVAGIDLNHANLGGALVKEFSLLSDMSFLHLNSNRFTGNVPDTFKDLSSLKELDLSNNHLSGPFPSVTLLMPNLIYLDLRFNFFSGPLPEYIFDKNFDAIFLNNNQFEGEIPSNLGSSPASVINLANNKFSGSIPPSFGYMGPALKEILFLNNQLTGCIPEGVGFLNKMEVLDVSFNSLTGHLPDTISCLNEIEVLNLAHNKLSGVLPDMVCSLGSLVNLTVSFNFFSGFSQECSKLFFSNVDFDISKNCIPGKDMQRPQPQCTVIPGGELNCLRIPLTRPIVCGSMFQTPESQSEAPSNTLSPSISP